MICGWGRRAVGLAPDSPPCRELRGWVGLERLGAARMGHSGLGEIFRESGSLRAVSYERVSLGQRQKQKQKQKQIPCGNDRKKSKSKDLLGLGHTFPLMTMELS